MGTDKGRSPVPCPLPPAVEWRGDALQVLRSLEELALRDLWAQTERLWRASGRTLHASEEDEPPRRTPGAEHGALTRARMAAMDALELYSHAQGARAAAEQRARWRREEEEEDGHGNG